MKVPPLTRQAYNIDPYKYLCDDFYHPEADGGISILDESLGIDWRIPMDKAILSEKDTKHPVLKDCDSPF